MNEKKTGARQFFCRQKCTQNIPKVTQKKGTEAHTHLIKNIKPKTMVRKDDRGAWSMNFNLPSKNRGKDDGNGEENKDNDGNNRGPPKVVNTDTSSSQS